jgi:hypothetical protein
MNCFEVLDTCSKIDKALLPRILYLDTTIAMRTTLDPDAPLKEHVMIYDNTNRASPPVSVLSICLKNNQSIFGALSLYGKRSCTSPNIITISHWRIRNCFFISVIWFHHN